MKKGAYYNEIDPYAVEWLKTLIMLGVIEDGEVDNRPIQEVRRDDLQGFKRCHFFAGIAGWGYALSLAKWPEDREVWTGSCPCQPFSVAGKQKGKTDERHLWPIWFNLIRELRPATIFGEQVSGAIAHGWLDDVYQGLEAESYAVGAAVLPACSVGAPHKRDRLWFVADSRSARWGARSLREQGDDGEQTEQRRPIVPAKSGETSLPLADAEKLRCKQGESNGSGYAEGSKSFEWGRFGFANDGYALSDTNLKSQGRPPISRSERNFWQPESGVCKLAHGIPGRVGRLRAYGNAIVPPLAAEFINAFLEAERDL